MSNARINIQWQYKTVCLFLTAIVLSSIVQAQLSLKRQKYDSIAAHYKNEHAVYTEITHKLVIKEEEWGLQATSTVVQERLFISDKSLNAFNTDRDNGIYAGFSYSTRPYTTAYIPDGNDYRSILNYGTMYYQGLTKNAITRTTYTMWHPELRMLPNFSFSNNLPSTKVVFEVTAPKYVKMGFLVKGPDTNIIKRSVTEKNGMMIYTFTAANVPADKNYEGVHSDNYYKPHVIPYINSFRLTGAKKDSVLSGDGHHKFDYSYVRGLNLENDDYINKKATELTRSAYSDREKVQRIYDWVQTNFHYKAVYDDAREGLVPHQADTVCKRMYGDCKDMASVFTTMCRKAGINAYFVLIGTHNKPYTHEELQSEYLYDHMIAAVKLDGEWIFLDGTTHVMPMGANRADLQGKEANILIDDHNHKVVKIPEAPASKNVLTSNTTMNLNNNDVSGTTYNQYSGYPAWDIGEALALRNRKEEKDEFVRSLASMGNNKFLISNYNINAGKSGNKDVSLNANYTLGGYVQQVKRDYYVNLNLNRAMAETRVNDDDRNVPYYFEYKHTIKETVTLNIPKGYRVSYLPKAAKGGVEGLWTYSITYKSDAKTRTVVLTKEYVLNTLKIDPKDFEAHNKLVDEVNKQYKETVVLSR